MERQIKYRSNLLIIKGFVPRMFYSFTVEDVLGKDYSKEEEDDFIELLEDINNGTSKYKYRYYIITLPIGYVIIPQNKLKKYQSVRIKLMVPLAEKGRCIGVEGIVVQNIIYTMRYDLPWLSGKDVYIKIRTKEHISE